MASVKPKKILAVDDEEVIRNFYRDSLTMKGYSVDHAVDGLDALGALWDSVYDLVITDINMPRLDGLGFYECARTRFPYLKDRFLFITGSPPGTVESLYGPERIMLKPFKIDELFDMVDRITAAPLDLQLEQDGLNRRVAQRVLCRNDCFMTSEGSTTRRPVAARTQDISAQWLQVRYFGETVMAGDRVRVRIGGTEASAGFRFKKDGQVVWAHGMNHVVCAGVSFNEPIPQELLNSLKSGAPVA